MPFRDLFLESLTTTPSDQSGLELTTVGDLHGRLASGPLPVMAIRGSNELVVPPRDPALER